MKEDKNMEMINKLTLLRAKQERQRKMQTKQNKVKKIVKPIEEKIDKPVEENTKKKRVVSEETKEKIRQKMLGKKHSAETIDKIKEIRLLKYARSVTSAEQLLLNLHPAPISNELALNFPVTAKSALLHNLTNFPLKSMSPSL